MKTLDEAIQEIERSVSGEFNKPYLSSEFRNNLEESVIFIATQCILCSSKEIKSKERKEKALQEIINTVSPGCTSDTIIKITHTHKFKEIMDDCEIIKHHIECSKREGEGMNVNDLNDKYKNKFLIFNGDEDGTQIVLVKDIHKSINDLGEFQVDGVMIELCSENHRIGMGVLVYDIEDFNFERFHYFSGPENCDEGYDSAEDLDRALMSKPMDTDYKTHVISQNEVVSEIMWNISWAMNNNLSVNSDSMFKIFQDLSKQFKEKRE